MRVVIGCDHAGLRLKATLAERLVALGHEVVDVGTHGESSVDYPDFARQAAELIASGHADRGVLVCGTGQGMAIAANKVPGVRAACVSDPFSARMIVEHNDAQIVTFGQRVTGEGVALLCLDAWLDARFAGGRHVARVEKIGR
jgi:ribose 5-phosphate isomerase B